MLPLSSSYCVSSGLEGREESASGKGGRASGQATMEGQEAETRQESEGGNTGQETQGKEEEEEVLLRTAVSQSQKRIPGLSKVLDEFYVSYQFPGKTKDDRDAQKQGEAKDVAQKGPKEKLSKAQKRKRKRQESIEDRGFMKRAAWESICSSVVAGVPCERLEKEGKCRFSHDVAEYMKHKPPMLENLSCNRFENTGFCSYSFKCLVGAKHLVPSEESGLVKNIDKREEEAKTDGFNDDGECNMLPRDLQVQIRKKSYHWGAHVDEMKEPRGPIDFSNKIYIAPLTTVGNLPFRRIQKDFGADITCGEMALAKCLVQASKTEWSLVRRHRCEDVFGVQLAGGDAKMMAKAALLVHNETNVDFIDLNIGCPIDLVCNQGAGSALLNKPGRLESIVDQITRDTQGRIPVGIKVRTGWASSSPTTHTLTSLVQSWKHTLPFGRSIAYFSIHGRSRTARYTNYADWDFIQRCCERSIATESFYRTKHAGKCNPLAPVPVFGNGDVMSFTDWYEHMDRVTDWIDRLKEIEHEYKETNSRLHKTLNAPEQGGSGSPPLDDLDALKASLTTLMIGRGALIKPWLSTEIKERRHWDISGTERLEIVKSFCNYGLEHWGSDSIGVQKTRRFLLEWMSFTCRYVPIGIMDSNYIPQKMNDRPPLFRGRDDRECLLSSYNVDDWIKVSEIYLGKAPDGFRFVPKHKSNSFNPRASDILSVSQGNSAPNT